LEVFNHLRLQHLGIGKALDANGHGGNFSKLRGAVPPCAEDDLEATLTVRPYKQGRENALAADGFGLMFRKRLCDRCGGKPHGWWRCAF
jgi:hypothetical protein